MAKVGDVAGVKVEDVHRVENVYDGVSISIHIYGRLGGGGGERGEMEMECILLFHHYCHCYNCY